MNDIDLLTSKLE